MSNVISIDSHRDHEKNNGHPRPPGLCACISVKDIPVGEYPAPTVCSYCGSDRAAEVCSFACREKAANAKSLSI